MNFPLDTVPEIIRREKRKRKNDEEIIITFISPKISHRYIPLYFEEVACHLKYE